MPSNEIFTGEFQHAIRDYFYLINLKYPEKGSLKLTGDRYRLTGDQRTILYRGVTSDEKAESRSRKKIDAVKGEYLYLDAYNVLFTILNYRLGKRLFIGFDSYLRDAGSLFGKLRDDKLFEESIDLLFTFLCDNRPELVYFYLDSPVSHSQKHACLIRKKMEACNLTGTCEVVKSADHFLKEPLNGIIATSDTAIIDSTSLKIADIPFLILGDKPGILRLNDFRKSFETVFSVK